VLIVAEVFAPDRTGLIRTRPGRPRVFLGTGVPIGGLLSDAGRACASSRRGQRGSRNRRCVLTSISGRVDDFERVWIIREGNCGIIGRRNAVCAEMSRFLASAALREGGT
jgi:hypothetical protein